MVLIGVAALYTELVASRHPQANMLDLTAVVRDGFYSRERSSAFPGPHGFVDQAYRWTGPTSRLVLWPAIPAAGILELGYLIPPPLGRVRLEVGQRFALYLLPARNLRTLHLLLPPAGGTHVRLIQTAPMTIQNRELGAIVSSSRWWAVAPRGWAGVLAACWRLLGGLPLTLALLAGLGLLLRLPYRWTIGLMALLLGVTAAVAVRSPWDSRAIQPTLQALAVYAAVGTILCYVARRVGVRSWTAGIGGVWMLSWVLFFHPAIYSDGVGYYAYVRSIFVDGDLRFYNELDSTQTPLRAHNVAVGFTRTGYVHNPFSAGPAIVWTPFWLLAHGITWAGQRIGLAWHLDGYAPPYVVLVTLASALAGLATMIGSFVIVRRWFTEAIAALAAITIYFGSNLLFYAQINGSFAHSISAATATWFFLAVLQLDEAPTRRRWLALGLATGLMLVTYWITVLLLIAPFLVVLRHGWRRMRQGDWYGLAWLGIGAIGSASLALLVFAPQMFAWKTIYGSWLVVPQGQDFVTPRNIQLAAALFSPFRGMAWWTPAYFAGLIGSAWFALRSPWPGRALLATIVVYVIYNASLPDWHGSDAFGMRRLAALAPVFALGLAAIFSGVRWNPTLPVALASLLSGWGVRMAVYHWMQGIPHDLHTWEQFDLRAVLLSPDLFPIRSFRILVQQGWIGTFFQAPGRGNAMILVACLLIISGVLLAGRRLRWRPIVGTAGTGAR